MSVSEFDDYKVNHLFLLIGENPLPNYVAARLLLKEKGTAYLVYSSGTEQQAEHLKSMIGLKSTQFVSLNDDESNAYKIKQAIYKELEKLKGTKVGLNYTGGTKAMSVHSYRALFYEEVDKSKQLYEKRSDLFCSYLDSRRLTMYIDNENGNSKPIKLEPGLLPEELSPIKIKTIFALHDLDWKQEPSRKAKLAKLATVLAEVYQDESLKQEWLNWFFQVFCEEARKKKRNGDWGDWQSERKLINSSIPVNKLPEKIVATLQSENLINHEVKLSLQRITQQEVFSKIKHFCEWLKGIWLEHYVLTKIVSISDNKETEGLTFDYGMDFQVPSGKDEFQFDVAFTKGYQLFAISCTTDDQKNLCKAKLFEAYIRARQMGGDEARVALVCCYSEPEILKAELVSSLDDKRIQVFGKDDLSKLEEKIVEWIRDVDKETK